jgi:hypothetical protein
VTPIAPLIAAAAEALDVCRAIGEPACLIGGLAVQRWGQPRATQDVDLTVLAPIGSEARLVDQILVRLAPRTASARQFALDRRVLLVTASNGVKVDMSLAALPFEHEVLDRATPWKHVSGVSLDTCSAEDLIIYKLIAARPQDLVDVTSIVRRQGNRLDVERVRHWGREFADLKEDPDLLRPFEDAVRRG